MISIQSLGDPEMVSALIWLEAERLAPELEMMLQGVPLEGLSVQQELARTMILIILTELKVRKLRKQQALEKRFLPGEN